MNKFKIIIPVYNAEKYIGKCINSIKSQYYPNWECVIIDDASTDNTFNIAWDTIGDDKRFATLKNYKNQKAIANVIMGIKHICNDGNDILCFVDGDDWLYCDDALEYLNDIYNNKDILLTYGQYITDSDIKDNKTTLGCSKEIFSLEEVREPKNNFSHLKTMRYKVWKCIKDEDLRRWDGKYIQRAWDSPIMRPAIEVCGLDRIKYVDKPLYVYNNLNPINEYKIDEPEELRENQYICDKESYERRSFMDHMIFTEIVNAGKAGRISLDSFHKHHNHKVHVYGTQEDFKMLIPNDNNILIDVGNEFDIMEGYKDPAHWGMFLLWAKIITETEAQNIIHFDSDVVFRGDIISEMIMKAEEGFDLIGPRRRYAGHPTVCPTTLISFNKEKLPKYDRDTTTKFLCSAFNPDGLYNTDFFDVPMYTIIKNGGKVFHLDYNDVGGVAENGNRDNVCGSINHSIEVGNKIAHFCGVGSGQDLYNTLRSQPEQREDGYAGFAIGNYAVFCKIFYNEDVEDVELNPTHQEILQVPKEDWY